MLLAIVNEVSLVRNLGITSLEQIRGIPLFSVDDDLVQKT